MTTTSTKAHKPKSDTDKLTDAFIETMCSDPRPEVLAAKIAVLVADGIVTLREANEFLKRIAWTD
jgi:hypothetical protein